MTENKVWNEMEVPMELDSVIMDAVAEGHKRLRRRQTRKHWRTAAISMATAAACFLAVVIGFVNPVVAKAYSSIPLIGNIFAYLYDTGDSEIPFAQVGEAAVPVEQGGQADAGQGQEDAGQGQTDAGQADWADAGQADQVDSGNQGNPEQQEGLAAGEEVAGGEAEAEDPVRIALKEYFCDGYSLYLSFEVTSEEPFLESVEDIAGKKGGIFLYAAENITTETGERFEGNGSLTIKGIFTDQHTFVGIARSGSSLEGYPVTDGLTYEMRSGHMRVFITDEANGDIKGQWEVSAEITCAKEPLLTEQIGQTILGAHVLKEVAVQPYEIQVVIEEPKGTSLTEEYIWIEVFDDKGRRLDWASQSTNRFVEDGEKRQKIFMFEKPMDAEKITIFALDELKWMDEWKGYLYCDEPWSGEQMIEFLKENCFTYGEVELPQSN
nr:hypothetical protein [uncultured Acetatifactor sp.]